MKLDEYERAIEKGFYPGPVKLSIVMPTIEGREDELAISTEAYERLTPVEIEWIIERDHPTCGAAWNAGVPKATGEVLHMGADDIQPMDGWWEAAMSVLEIGGIPLGWVNERGVRFGRDFPRVVICMREWWVDVAPELHYYTDNQFGDLMVEAGHPLIVAEGFDFYHRKSMVGRGAGMGNENARMAHDLRRWQEVARGD